MLFQNPFKLNTPYYQYDLELLDRTLCIAREESKRYGFQIHYAVKANYDKQILRKIRSAGFGIDCVSGNEVSFALNQGFKAESLVFAGVGKSDYDIEMSLKAGILCLNIESLEELEVVASIAESLELVAAVALRLNPDISAHTHPHITTGKSENKFGIPESQLQRALNLCIDHPWIKFRGLHFHIGSQITSLEPFRELCKKVNQIWDSFNIQSYGPDMINLGGGLGIDYHDPEKNPIPDFEKYFRIFHENLRLPSMVKRHFELGRSLTAQCGSLITKVLYVKDGAAKKHVIVDAGMTELIRPVLYGAFHKIENTKFRERTLVYDVVGPICESSDHFAKGIELSETNRGDILQIHSCGAYAESMSMNYNLRGTIGRIYNE